MTRSASYCFLFVGSLVLFSPGSAEAGFIINGGFEAPLASSPFQTLTGTELTGWTVTSGSIDLINGYWPAFEGRQSIDLAGSTKNGGALEQTFATTAGVTYLLTFNYANNVDVSAATARVDVIGSSSLFTQNLSHSGSSSTTLSNMNYTAFSATFTANSSLTTLQFTSTGPDPVVNRDNGIVLDNVNVVQVVPTPPTVVLLSSGIVCLLVWRVYHLVQCSRNGLRSTHWCPPHEEPAS